MTQSITITNEGHLNILALSLSAFQVTPHDRRNQQLDEAIEDALSGLKSHSINLEQLDLINQALDCYAELCEVFSMDDRLYKIKSVKEFLKLELPNKT
jgi:hypothetical protein